MNLKSTEKYDILPIWDSGSHPVTFQSPDVCGKIHLIITLENLQ